MSILTVKNINNKPTFCSNDEIIAPVIYALSDIPASSSASAQAYHNIKNFGKAGVNLVAVDANLNIGWRKVTPFDSEGLLAEITAVTDANPDALVFLRIHVNPPYWWMRDNPDECIVYRTTKGDFNGIDDGEPDRLIRNDGEHKFMRVSLASRKWIDDAKKCLEIFLESLKGTKEADSLVAIQIACGTFGEWHQWGVDVSKPMQSMFYDYLNNKYQTDENLQKAWNNPNVTIKTAKFHPEPSYNKDHTPLRNPQTSQESIDSQHCLQIVAPKTILEFCKTVKKVMPDILCGSFYGYYFGVSIYESSYGGNCVTVGGHLCPEILFEAREYIDFLCGPFPYTENRNADGVPMQRVLAESMRLHNMLWLTEMDQRPIGVEKFHAGDPKKLDETICAMRRDCIYPLLCGLGFWFYDHRTIPLGNENPPLSTIYRKSGWWDKAELMTEVANIYKLSHKIANRKYESVADVLLVYDTDSLYYRTVIDDKEYMMHKTLSENGVVFDCIYDKDISICDITRYKCVIFANSQKVDENHRKLVREISQKCLVIHMNAHGCCDGYTISDKNISDTVGMNMKATEAESVIFDDNTIDIQSGAVYPYEICDTDATPIAHYNNGKVAAAIKNNDVYIPIQYIPATLCDKLMKQVKVHRWCDSGEPVIAGGGFVLINCHRKGTRTLNLPNGKRITVKSNGFSSQVYDIESGEQIMA